MTRRGRAATVTLAVTVAASAALTAVVSAALAPAAQATSYRYWSYWHADAQGWTYSTSGAGTFLPEDGTVEGWRLSVGGTDAPLPPAAPASFASICSGVDLAPGGKRIALVIDPGPASIAPAGETPGPVSSQCLQVRSDASGYDVLAAAGAVRAENGLVCGIGGYPATECATPVDDSLLAAQASASARSLAPPAASAPAISPTATYASSTSVTGGLASALSGRPSIALAILVILAALGWVQWKRRRG